MLEKLKLKVDEFWTSRNKIKDLTQHNKEMTDTLNTYLYGTNGIVSQRAISIANSFQTKNIMNSENYRIIDRSLVGREDLENLYQGGAFINRVINLIINEIFNEGFNLNLDKRYADRQGEYLVWYTAKVEPIVKLALRDCLVQGGGLCLMYDDSQNSKNKFKYSANSELYHMPYRLYSALPHFGAGMIVDGVSQFIIGSVGNIQIKSNISGQYSYDPKAIDSSFFINFKGLPVEYKNFPYYKYQGGSFISPNFEAIKADEIIVGTIGNLSFRNGVLIYKLEDYLSKLSGSKEDAINFFRNVELLNNSINATGMATIDSKSTLESLSAEMIHYKDLSEQAQKRMLSYFGYSFTKIMGQSPQGMNSTGQADIANDIQTTKQYQKHFKEGIVKSHRYGLTKFFGEEIDFDFEYGEIETMTPEVKAEYQKKMIENSVTFGSAVTDRNSLDYLYENDLIEGARYEELKKEIEEQEKLFKEELEEGDDYRNDKDKEDEDKDKKKDEDKE